MKAVSEVESGAGARWRVVGTLDGYPSVSPPGTKWPTPVEVVDEASVRGWFLDRRVDSGRIYSENRLGAGLLVQHFRHNG